MKKLFVSTGLVALTFCFSACQNSNNPEGIINPVPWKNVLSNYAITSICVSGNSLIAGTIGGTVLLSNDNGSNWMPVDTLHSVNGAPGTNFRVATTVALYRSGSDIFAGASALEGSIDVSTDNGMSWTEKDTSFHQNVNDFASIGSIIFAGTNNGVYRSTDNGKSWEPVNSGLSYSNYDSIYGHAPQVWTLIAVGSDLFAGTTGEGIFRSTDYGMSWTQVDNGLNNLGVYGLASIGADLFAGSFSDNSTGGVFISTDKGSSWQPVNTGLTNHMINFLYSYGTDLYAGSNTCIFHSTNDGASWTVLDSLSVSTLASNGPDLLAGTGSGIIRVSP